MLMANRQVEFMSRFQIGGLTVRVWSTSGQTVTMGPDPLVETAINDLGAISPTTVAKALDKLHADTGMVAAYEILDKDGNGVVVYPDWS